jgi:hypothetical protein
MSQKNLKLSFVIPVMNEDYTLEKLFLGFKQAISKTRFENFEVIFIKFAAIAENEENESRVFYQVIDAY